MIWSYGRIPTGCRAVGPLLWPKTGPLAVAILYLPVALVPGAILVDPSAAGILVLLWPEVFWTAVGVLLSVEIHCLLVPELEMLWQQFQSFLDCPRDH